MKTKLFFLPVLALTATLSVSAQQIENDDVYFTAKDRAKEKAAVSASLSTNNDIVARGIRSTDQYSGRTVNPEYSSRLNANSATVQGSDNPYFDSNYKPSSSNSNSGYYNNSYNSFGANNWNGGYGNSFYGNSLYGNSFYSPYSSNLYGYSGMYGFGSPYSSFYSPFGYSSGLSFGMGMGMGYGFGSGFYSPYYGYGGLGGFYGYPSYYGYGYPSTVVINGGDAGSNMVYGKRGSRSSSVNNPAGYSNRGSVSPGSAQTGSGLSPVGGRTSGSSSNYYQPNWRNNPDVNSAITNGRQSSGSSMTRSQSLGTQNPSWNNGNSRQMQSPSWNSISPSRQQSFPGNNSFGTPSRGSSPAWGGGGFGGGGGMSGGHSSGGGGSRGR